MEMMINTNNKYIFLFIIYFCLVSCDYTKKQEKKSIEDIVSKWVDLCPTTDIGTVRFDNNIYVELKNEPQIWSKSLHDIEAQNLAYLIFKEVNFFSKYDTLHITFFTGKPLVTLSFTEKEITNLAIRDNHSKTKKLLKYIVENLDHRTAKLYSEGIEVLRKDGLDRNSKGLFVFVEYSLMYDQLEKKSKKNSFVKGMEILKLMMNETQNGQTLNHFNNMMDIIENESVKI